MAYPNRSGHWAVGASPCRCPSCAPPPCPCPSYAPPARGGYQPARFNGADRGGYQPARGGYQPARVNGAARGGYQPARANRGYQNRPNILADGLLGVAIGAYDAEANANNLPINPMLAYGGDQNRPINPGMVAAGMVVGIEASNYFDGGSM